MNIAILSANPKLYSTQRLVEAIENNGHTAIVINHTKCSLIMQKGKPSIEYNGQILSDIDAVIPRIGASVTFFGAAVIRQFETMKIFTTLSSISLVRSRDKLRSLQVLSKVGLGIPKSVFAKDPDDDEIKHLISSVGGAPIVLKRLEGTQGVGVVLAETIKAAKSMIQTFSGMKENIIIQEFIEEADGADIRVLIVDGKIIGSMERKGDEDEFRSNLHRGGTARKIELTEKEKRVAIEAAKSLNLKIAGVDLLRSKRGALIIEVNSSPGIEGIEKTTGLDIANNIVEYIEHGVKNKKRTKNKDL
ncbi:MAG: 30S ribosomal protein S6--L-glutamate ligase [Candidatus Nomurabacteria bacterium]|nr:30S ribosomal protein S6--L-glutamate ligase [Candidatus Nomurabacteria bacterium]